VGADALRLVVADVDAYARWARETLPNALVLIHTVTDVDAPVGTDSKGDDNGRPNAEGWARIAPFIHGWLIQNGPYETAPSANPPLAREFCAQFKADGDGAELHSVAWHFKGAGGWTRDSAWGRTGVPILLYAAEHTAYSSFWQNLPERPRGRGEIWRCRAAPTGISMAGRWTCRGADDPRRGTAARGRAARDMAAGRPPPVTAGTRAWCGRARRDANVCAAGNRRPDRRGARTMKQNHWMTLAILLAGLGGMLSGLDHWSDAVHPPFVAGLLIVISSVLKAMYEDKPRAADSPVVNINGGR
jgi:hypothetical protein